MSDLPSLMAAPWTQPLLGLLVTCLASWWGARRDKNPGTSGITQTATTHGSNSPVTQLVNQHTWHITPPLPPEPSPRSGSSRAPRTDEDETAKAVGFIAALVLGIAALTWAVATTWFVVSTALTALTYVALFITALTWWRWPTGVRGAIGLRLVITVTGVAVLWALAALPTPVRSEPDLASISRLTAGLPLMESIFATVRLLWPGGLLAYEMRLGGLALLLWTLYQSASRGLGAVIAESGARRTPPALWLVRLGNRLIGSGTMGFGHFAGTAVGVAIAVALVHPVTAGWVLDRISQMTLALP